MGLTELMIQHASLGWFELQRQRAEEAIARFKPSTDEPDFKWAKGSRSTSNRSASAKRASERLTRLPHGQWPVCRTRPNNRSKTLGRGSLDLGWSRHPDPDREVFRT
jgi:hypothetical protein